MSTYAIKQDGRPYDSVDDLTQATSMIEQFLGGVDDGEGTTFTVEDSSGKVVACASSRRIIGTFVKQEWSRNLAVYVGQEDFDATDTVLSMAHREIVEIEDNDTSSDQIGLKHVDWSGPCSVNVEGSICRYFGVSSVSEITEEALSYVKAKVKPQETRYQTVTLTIKVKLKVAPGASVSSFTDNLDYSVISNTNGVSVEDTDLVDSQ